MSINDFLFGIECFTSLVGACALAAFSLMYLERAWKRRGGK